MEKNKYKVVVAEDDKFLSKAFKDKLEREGFVVFVASDGNEALKLIKKEKPNIILLDLVMPVKDGFEVLEEMRLDSSLKKVPVIILSNLGQESDIQKGKELGAVDYLIKADFTIGSIVKKIKEHIVK